MRRRISLFIAAAGASLLIAEPAWAQYPTSTVFGGFLATLLASVKAAIVGPIGNVLSYVSTGALTAVTIYIVGYGILVMLGRIPSPAGDAAVKAIKIGAVGLLIGGSSQYQTWVVDPFLIGNGGIPDGIASALGGATGVTAVDVLWTQVAAQISTLLDQFSVFAPVQAIGVGLAIATVFTFGVLCCSIAFLEIALTQISMAMVLMVGPFFIIAALFEETKGWFRAWLGELIHYTVTYALLVVAGTLVNALTNYWVGKAGSNGTGTLGLLMVYEMFICIGLVLAVFIFLQAGKIGKAIAGGSSSGGLAAAVNLARRFV